jgi:hypothetical protein
MQLRPVTFHYKPEYDDGSHLLEYGLIAEEVARVFPELVQADRSGKPLAVRSHLVNAMMLNEVQRQHRTIAVQQSASTSSRRRSRSCSARCTRCCSRGDPAGVTSGQSGGRSGRAGRAGAAAA